MFGPHPDDIPKLSEAEKEMSDLVIIHRGWRFIFSYGYLLGVYPS